jgi:hypothetical protein
MQCIQTPNCLPRVLYSTSLESASIFSHSKQKKGKAREFMTPAPESCSFNPSYVLSVVADLCCNNFYRVVRTRPSPKALQSRGSPAHRLWCRPDKRSCFLPLGGYSSSMALQSPSPYPSPPRVSSRIS